MMLLCNYELPPALVPPLVLPTPAATISHTSASAATSSIIVIVLVLIALVVVVHLMPVVAAVTPLASRSWAERVAAAPVAALAECTKKADLPSVDHCLHLRGLLCLLHLDNEDRVALAVPPSTRIDVYVVNLVIVLDDDCSARTLPFEMHHLQCAPNKACPWGAPSSPASPAQHCRRQDGTMAGVKA